MKMSADTFIWVWKFPDGYRVTGVEQAPDNLVYNKEYFDSYEEFKMVVDDYFKGSELYKTKEEAYKKVKEIEKEFYDDDDFYVWIEYWTIEYEFDFKI